MYREKIRIGAHISDIHLGVTAITPEEFKYQLYERFIKPLSEMMILDYITINGDISHLPLSFNSKHSEVYLWLFDSLVEIAKKKDASIVVVKGTLSHDVDHILNVKFYENDPDLEIYFIDEPSVVDTKGIRMYCLPDIHISNSREEKQIYDYPDDHFDMIMGHGCITETQFIKQETEYSISKNIIYDSKELLRMSKGPILFGHIHAPMNIRKRIFYLSSFTRFAHSEEGNKGWGVTAYVPDSGKFVFERVVNDLAFNFNTYTIKHTLFDKLDADDVIQKVDKFIDEHDVDKLCLEINYHNTEINIAKIHILRKYFSRNKIVNKLKFKALSAKEIEFRESVEEKDKDNSKDYLRDKSIPFEEKLQRFIKESYHVDLSLEKIQTILTSDDLLSRGE